MFQMGGGFPAFPRGGIFSPDEHPRLCWILLDTANEACCNNAELVVMFSGYYYCHFGHAPHHCHHNAVTTTITTSQGALNMTLADIHFPSLIIWVQGPIAIPKIVESPAIINHCSKIQDKIKLRKSDHININGHPGACNHAVPSHRRQSRVKQSSVWWRRMSGTGQHTNGTRHGQGDKK